MDNSKIRNVSKNIFFATFSNVIGLFLSFAVRRIFILQLGSEYVGLNSLFVNVLGVLSFAELGIGVAVTASLYAPLNQGNFSLIKAYLEFYRKFMNFVALLVEVMGIIVGLFIPFLIHNQSSFSTFQLWLYFVLFTTSSAVSYLLTYKRILLTADQADYISSSNNLVFKIIIALFQIFFLIYWKSYLLYLITQIVFTLLSNIVINRKINSMYGHIFKLDEKKSLSKKERGNLKKDIVGMISAKIGGIILTSSDNIMISMFLGLGILGRYANYAMLISGAALVLNQIFGSLTPSIGNFRFVSKDIDYTGELTIFERILKINYLLVIISSIALSLYVSVFVKIWLNSKFILPNIIAIVIIVNFAVNQFRQVVIVFMSAYGLFWQQRYKSILEALINIMLSISLLIFTNLGIISVLLGTILTNIGFNLIWEFFIVKRHAIKNINIKNYFVQYFFLLFFLIGIVTINIELSWMIMSSFTTLFSLCILSAVFILELLFIVVFVSIFSKDVFHYMKSKISNFF